jgi:hypothetical protein
MLRLSRVKDGYEFELNYLLAIIIYTKNLDLSVKNSADSK